MAADFSPNRRRLLAAGAASTALVAAAGWSHHRRASSREPHTLRGPTMGSTYSVKLHAPGLDAGGLAEARSAVQAVLGGIVAHMSTFDPDSELSRLNRSAPGRPVAVSAELAGVLAAARSVSEASTGAFDVTIAPVVDAWGFGPRAVRARPAAAALAHARSAVGWRALGLDLSTCTATREHPALALDLSGIAQGHGADRVAATLDRLGFADYLVDVCGEIRARGRNGRGEPWRVGIERPDAMPRRVHRVVPLSDMALATSGDYRIWFEQDGMRYHHEIDPGTAAPARHALASVSVAAPDATSADAWSTALFVLGPEAGFALARARGLAAHFIERRPGGFVDRSTPAFESLGSWRA